MWLFWLGSISGKHCRRLKRQEKKKSFLPVVGFSGSDSSDGCMGWIRLLDSSQIMRSSGMAGGSALSSPTAQSSDSLMILAATVTETTAATVEMWVPHFLQWWQQPWLQSQWQVLSSLSDEVLLGTACHHFLFISVSVGSNFLQLPVSPPFTLDFLFITNVLYYISTDWKIQHGFCPSLTYTKQKNI